MPVFSPQFSVFSSQFSVPSGRSLSARRHSEACFWPKRGGKNPGDASGVDAARSLSHLLASIAEEARGSMGNVLNPTRHHALAGNSPISCYSEIRASFYSRVSLLGIANVNPHSHYLTFRINHLRPSFRKMRKCESPFTFQVRPLPPTKSRPRMGETSGSIGS
ncbi:hypothetical protein ACP_1602 [Acidobacterium capsulatum ATCC 51196]|uniref:Uncharacterized protein n=1 Tax=Acidobacterium capsulatum (strain ATCC 51196 / DSM 11244 / BCRC 80197 / JCM 7670 / NBRC 15755 / NCIMB 13165 / 161) TaxID=240015 RepID=C1F748_ACIC5|nr:hypothetical protein ACP_1602 [Acidobacterium capsulatum ATCC 51196]